MRVRVGIVAPRGARATFESAAASLPAIDARWLLYDREEGIAAIVEASAPECDALCFSGEVPYQRSIEVIPPDLPLTVVRLTSIDVALCLLRAQRQGIPIEPLSVDTADEQLVAELVAELNLNPSAIAHLPHAEGVDITSVIAFHVDAHARLQTTLAITGRSNAVAALGERLDIAVVSAVPVQSSIRGALNRAVLAATNRRQADRGFGAALFRVVAQGDLMESEARRLALAHGLHRVAELTDAWVDARSGAEDVLVFGHRRLMRELTLDWTAIPFLHEVEAHVAAPVAIGIGLGDSARRSVEYAESALHRAIRDGGSCGYVLSHDGVVIGPLTPNATNAPRHRFRSEDMTIANVARDLGLGIGTLTRLLQLERELGGEPITAAELARQLRLSPASGRRISRKLDEQGLVTWAGVAHPGARGRPTRLLRLDLRRVLQKEPAIEPNDALTQSTETEIEIDYSPLASVRATTTLQDVDQS